MKPRQIINYLKSERIGSICPECNSHNDLSECEVFEDKRFESNSIQVYQSMLDEIETRKAELVKMKEQSFTWLTTNTRSVNVGFIVERLIPAMNSFEVNHTDCRPMFDPLDYIIFEGLSTKGYVESIKFVDIKTGNARLSKRQEEIKSVVKHRNVKFRTY